MKEADRKKRNEEKLNQLYPTFRKRVARVILLLEKNNWRPRIQEAWRSPADQEKAYKSGHSKLLFGFHNVTGTNGAPESLAVDLLDDDAALNPSQAYLLQLAATAEAAGLVTGIRWGLPANLGAGIDAAIQNKNWSAPIKVGWDPTHIQPTGITVAQAKAKIRPT